MLGYVGLHIATLLIMGLYTLARSLAALLTPARRAPFENTRLMWRYAVVMGLTSLIFMHGFPLAVG